LTRALTELSPTFIGRQAKQYDLINVHARVSRMFVRWSSRVTESQQSGRQHVMGHIKELSSKDTAEKSSANFAIGFCRFIRFSAGTPDCILHCVAQ
jgi:hypothetical protein